MNFKSFKESKPDDEVENVRVVVRVRANETIVGKSVVVCDKNSKTVTVQKPNSSANEPPKVYQFDSVFGEDSTQVRRDESYWFLCLAINFYGCHLNHECCGVIITIDIASKAVNHQAIAKNTIISQLSFFYFYNKKTFWLTII